MWNPITLIQKFDQRRNSAIKIKSDYQAYCVYDWYQGTETGVWKSGGICAAMSMDWLRRKFQGLKNFNDPKYADASKSPGSFSLQSKFRDLLSKEANPKRVKMIQKIDGVQSYYSVAWKQLAEMKRRSIDEIRKGGKTEITLKDLSDRDPEAALFEANPDLAAFRRAIKQLKLDSKKVPKGFDRLQMIELASIQIAEAQKTLPKAAPPSAFLAKEIIELLGQCDSLTLKPGMNIGGYIGFHFPDGTGHAIGAFILNDTKDPRHTNQPYSIFEPNFGEYAFEQQGHAGQFMMDLADGIYATVSSVETYIVVYNQGT
jgi:hypothetical protein